MSLPDRIDTPAVATPGRIGQATAVEQSRAVAEVQAAVIVAQQCPRDIARSRSQMQVACSMPGLAERAFYRFPRSGQTVSGPSVYLARELARCWGNTQYGIAELRRDDEHGQSEMQAWAWDVEANTRSASTFIVPHGRDKTDKKTNRNVIEPLTSLRDVYENNTNQASRRLREAIFSILPSWFTEEAKDIATHTVGKGDGKPLPDAIAAAIALFEGLGVTLGQLEQRLGSTSAKWNLFDLAQLRIAHRSIQRGEITIEDEFPQRRVTVAEITAPTTKDSTP